MRASEREDRLYATGKRTRVTLEERILFTELGRTVPAGSDIVDVGCGSGEVGLEIAAMGHRVVGFDFSGVAVELAVAQGLDARQVDLDGEGIPLADASVDAVYAGDVIEHVFDPGYLHREFHRVLRPGGRVFASVPHDANALFVYRALRADSPQRTTYERRGQCKHHSFISVPLMKHFADAAGLSLDRMMLIGRAWGRIRRWNDRVFTSSTWTAPTWRRMVSDRLCFILEKPRSAGSKKD